MTGGTGAIGSAIVDGLAAAGVPHLIATCRPGGGAPAQRCAALNATLRARHPAARIQLEVVDLSSVADVRALCGRLAAAPLRIVVNNAAAAPRARQTTAEGLELQLATNVLAYLQLMRCTRAALAANAPSRIVNVASELAGGLDVDDLQREKKEYDGVETYAAAKQADIMLSWEAADRYAADRIAVHAAHPGSVPSSRLVREALGDLAAMMGTEVDTPAQAAATEVLVATNPALANVTGRWWVDRRIAEPRPFGAAEPRRRLWQRCVALIDATANATAAHDGNATRAVGVGHHRRRRRQQQQQRLPGRKGRKRRRRKRRRRHALLPDGSVEIDTISSEE